MATNSQDISLKPYFHSPLLGFTITRLWEASLGMNFSTVYASFCFALFTVLAQPSFGKYPSRCAAHSKCKNLTGTCCPTVDGVFLDCCDAQCSMYPKCANLSGDCCPTKDHVILDCCNSSNSTSIALSSPPDMEPKFAKAPNLGPQFARDDSFEDPTTCAAHSKCKAANLSGACCPTQDGRMLECCDAECSKHAKCGHLKGPYCCPTDDKVMLDCCTASDANSSIVV